jgi:predicted ATP-dependent serine protease
VNRIENRIREAGRLGFNSIMISGAYDKINLPLKEHIQVIKVNRVEEALKKLFGDEGQGTRDK